MGDAYIDNNANKRPGFWNLCLASAAHVVRGSYAEKQDTWN